jgi:thiol-disulfide isomerase/thioredoxin
LLVQMALLILVLCWAGTARAEKALQLVLPDLEGKTFSLEEELQKGPVVFDFWATWCKPCIKALPKLQQIARDYGERGVQVFAVNIDGPRNLPKVRPFLQRHRLELPVLLDKTNEVMQQFHLTAMPATLVIAPDGEVVYKHQGYRPGDEEKLRQKLDELLATPTNDED